MEQHTKQYRPLEKMFIQVPDRYDLMNRILTLRLDEIWRKKTARLCMSDSSESILDVCTGTGDLAIRLAKMSKGKIKITALDFSQPMLEKANQKAKKRGINNIETIYGDVASLPFNDNSFDSVCIGFAFRNLTYKNPKTKEYLSEIYRIIKPGGKFVIAESSQPGNKVIKKLFNLYMNVAVKWFGGIISGHKSAYRYLASSAINFYNPEQIQELLKSYGFNEVVSYQQMGGVAAIHEAFK